MNEWTVPTSSQPEAVIVPSDPEFWVGCELWCVTAIALWRSAITVHLVPVEADDLMVPNCSLPVFRLFTETGAECLIQDCGPADHYPGRFTYRFSWPTRRPGVLHIRAQLGLGVPLIDVLRCEVPER
ncbi:hypothetical protein M2280_005966 [Prescottella agglutinans]|uniref:Uncharacterized protein n=1 Tax=Prescottella agglutinans TaxID=1644129 RepID=A0ABT6MLD1_9NOCA|nr:hypothetical protein [Prescottella agglutinans]